MYILLCNVVDNEKPIETTSKELTPGHWKTVKLYYMKGLSPAEIVKVMAEMGVETKQRTIRDRAKKEHWADQREAEQKSERESIPRQLEEVARADLLIAEIQTGKDSRGYPSELMFADDLKRLQAAKVVADQRKATVDTLQRIRGLRTPDMIFKIVEEIIDLMGQARPDITPPVAKLLRKYTMEQINEIAAYRQQK